MTDTEAQLDQANRDLEVARERQAAAGAAMGDAAGSPHQFDRARSERDVARSEVERLELLWRNLQEQLAAERERTRAEARAFLEQQATDLDVEIGRLDQDLVAAARHIATTIRRIEAVRAHGMETGQRLNPRQIYPSAREPLDAYRAVAGCANALRKSCTFGKSSLESEFQFPLPEETSDDHDQAA
jgi:hypothetical protein